MPTKTRGPQGYHKLTTNPAPLELQANMKSLSSSSSLSSILLQPWTPFLVTLGVIGLFTLVAFVNPPGDDLLIPQVRLAFIGNSFTFVNDLPRVMEAYSVNASSLKKNSTRQPLTITQRSCLHGGANFRSLLLKGNGMLPKWGDRQNAEFVTEDGILLHDCGLCTVRQLLLGEDSMLSVNNCNRHYHSKSHRNPCFEDEAYLEWTLTQQGKNDYDFVILNDHSRRPGIESQRQVSLRVLEDYYVPLIQATGATPVFLATHGYISNVANTSGMGGVPEFTARVLQGYQEYAQLVAQLGLPEPRIAKTGLAFLYVYDRNYTLWKRLFYRKDTFHPSPYGTYLMSCTLYVTLFRKMPPVTKKVEALFSRARRLYPYNRNSPFPTTSETKELNRACKMVALHGYVPESLPDLDSSYDNDDDYHSRNY